MGEDIDPYRKPIKVTLEKSMWMGDICCCHFWKIQSAPSSPINTISCNQTFGRIRIDVKGLKVTFWCQTPREEVLA